METGLEWERTGSWEIFEKYCGNLERHEGLNRGVIPSSIWHIHSFIHSRSTYQAPNMSRGGSPALQANSLLSEPPGKQHLNFLICKMGIIIVSHGGAVVWIKWVNTGKIFNIVQRLSDWTATTDTINISLAYMLVMSVVLGKPQTHFAWNGGVFWNMRFWVQKPRQFRTNREM